MSAQLQRVWDEAEALEQEIEELWPDPARLGEELDGGRRELARLEEEIRVLDGPARHRASLFVTSLAMAGVAVLALAAWLMQGGVL
jgi:hypothetical protein